MADLRRELNAVDAAAATEEAHAVARHYSHMAGAHSTVSRSAREHFSTLAIRNANNFVKACIIDAGARCVAANSGGAPLRVVDVACGRGQDTAKLRYAADAARVTVGAYHGVDVAAEAVVSCGLMADKYLPDARTRLVLADDAVANGLTALRPYSPRPHLVMCNLALHYFFRDAAAVQRLFADVAAILDPAVGLFIVSYTDGRAVVRRARDACARRDKDDVVTKDAVTDDVVVVQESPYYTLAVPTAHCRLYQASPYGLRYTFSLPDSIAAVPEYLVSEAAVTAQAQAAGLHPAASLAFDDALDRFQTSPRYRDIAAKMGATTSLGEHAARDAASLYRVNVFGKNPGVAAAFVAALMS